MAEPLPEIIRQAQAGSTEAFSQIIAEQHHYIYSIAMSVLKNPEDAADLTQEACIRLLRSIRQYNGESRFTTWLYRMVVNLGRDELRRRGRQVPIFTPPEDIENPDPLTLITDEDRWNDPQKVLDSSELRLQVRHALAQLEEHYRMVLTLYYFDDMKYADIAEILDIPLNTVKSHIRRGKDRLTALLTAQEQQPPTKRNVHQSQEHQSQSPPSSLFPIRLLM